MAAPNTAAAIALPILTLLAYLYHRATHRRPYNAIPYNPHSTRRLFGDMPELTAEAQRHRDPTRMLLSQFKRVRGLIIPFKPIVPGSSLAMVKGPECSPQVRLWSDIISVSFLRDHTPPIMHRAAPAPS